MENMVTKWCTTVKSVPQDYVFPEGIRPGDQVVPSASQDSGFFQVINHGINEDLIHEAMEVIKELFNMPDEDITKIYSLDHHKSCRLYTSSFDYVSESTHLWRDILKHPCHPLEDWVHLWPEKPSKYRDVLGKFSVEVRNLSFRILEMIREGLGLKPGYFGDELTGIQMFSVNHYPPCPEPSLALGISKHRDPNILTILYQGNTRGLQVLKDGQWFGVEPYDNAFVVNIGQQLKVITNGKFESSEHRVVTNSKESRYTIASFINPHSDTVIGPEKSIVDKDNGRPLYQTFRYKDFHRAYQAHKGEGEATIGVFKIDG
ncbi:Non-heme dioxygenase N-terminal domain-containing protein [Artemisia annua]|uniref:Non-heme dioxygenase N-terminal domain-containing protein n=1 Tax=Artemisia annua TaxID=35608 RepID=A0A2U1KS39_ARTAN|nr:Non-heme dioxygenase N-terminal domain-containing protein [Artemisia annua]